MTTTDDGWVRVPREPTEEMLLAAGGRTFDPSRWDDPTVDTMEIWSAMLAAAPHGRLLNDND